MHKYIIDMYNVITEYLNMIETLTFSIKYA